MIPPSSMRNDGGRLWVKEEQEVGESFHHVHSFQVLDHVTVLSIQQFELLKKKNLPGELPDGPGVGTLRFHC